MPADLIRVTGRRPILRRARPASTRRVRRAFTLIEIIVVVTILGILSAILVPRITGGSRREFELATDRVADLLLAFAQRDVMGREPLAIQLEHHRGDSTWRISLFRQIRDDRGAAEFIVDRTTQPVKLPSLVDAERMILIVDGEPLDFRGRPFVHVPGQDRPTIEILMESIDGAHRAHLRLPPYALGPQRLGGAVPVRTSVSLDAMGRSREPW